MTVERMVVGTASAGAGEKRAGTIQVELPDGEALGIDVWVVRGQAQGREPGPVLYVHSTQHGNEISGVEVVRQVVARLDVRKLRGTVIAVPIANPLAFHWRRHHYLQGAEEAYQGRPELDIDHFWPGDASGTHVQRVAYALWQEAVRHATHVLDMHTWNRWQAAATTVRAWHEPSLALARAFGLWVQRLPDPPPSETASGDGSVARVGAQKPEESEPGSITAVAIRHGKAACAPNFTGQWDIYEGEVRRGVAGLENVLRYLGMLPGEPVGIEGGAQDAEGDFGRTRAGIYAQPPVFAPEELVTVVAPAAGLFLARVKPEQRITRGQRLGVLVPYGELKPLPVLSPVDGYVQRIGAIQANSDVALPSMMPMATEGAPVARLLPAKTN